MTKGVRLVLTLVLSTVALMSLAVGAAVAAVYQAGAIAVDIQHPNGGDRINISVPAGLANLALGLVPVDALPVGGLEPLAEELEPIWPAAQAAIDELARMPDFVLVEVQDRDGRVVVEKVGKRILVRVDSEEERIRVSIPLSTVRRFCTKVERLLDRI